MQNLTFSYIDLPTQDQQCTKPADEAENMESAATDLYFSQLYSNKIKGPKLPDGTWIFYLLLWRRFMIVWRI